MATRGIGDWRSFRWLTCTGCGRAGRIDVNGWITSRHGPRRSVLGSGAHHAPKGDRATCGWTRCIRGTGRRARGVYHINAVDEVTQWQVVGATAKISEAWLIPVLEASAGLSFHSASWVSTPTTAASFINHRSGPAVEQTAGGADQIAAGGMNDKRTGECKNGAVVRKHMGYNYIAAPHAGGDRAIL